MREDLKKYSDFLQKIRTFFDNQSVLEVQTSALLNTPATDVYIDSLSMKLNQAHFSRARDEKTLGKWQW